jgi:hypothetical protein
MHVAVGIVLALEVLGDLGPEVVRVSLRSVMTVQLGRHDGSQELALRSRER